MSPNDAGVVLTRLEDRVSYVILNRPDRLNAITVELDAELRKAVSAADQDPDSNVICITGAGRGFCAGADLSEPVRTCGLDYKLEPERIEDFRFAYLLQLQKPVVAALNGAAVGVGLVIAAFCDIRLASSTAKFSLPYARLGLVAEYGIAWLLPQLVGRGMARDMLLSGRALDAAEACQKGLVDKVFEAETFQTDAAQYLADLAARCSPRSLGVIKRQLDRASTQTLLASVALADSELAQARQCADFKESIAAFKEKRSPVFGRP